MKQEIKRHFKKVDPILFRAIKQAGELEDITPQLGGMLDVNGNAIGDGTLELIKFV